MRNHFRKLAFIALVAAAPTTLNGCYGSFALTKNIHEWNGTVTSNKFVNTLLFWVMIILPVYGLSTLADAVIFNLIEFWTGANPLGSVLSGVKSSVSEIGPDGVTLEKDGKRYEITRLDERILEVRIDGVLRGRAIIGEDGSVEIMDFVKDRVVTVTPSEVERVAAHVEGRPETMVAAQQATQ